MVSKYSVSQNLSKLTFRENCPSKQSFISPEPILDLCWVRAHPNLVPWVLTKIFSSEMVKNDICLGVQANQMPFFQKMFPQKTHPCPQCLEYVLIANYWEKILTIIEKMNPLKVELFWSNFEVLLYRSIALKIWETLINWQVYNHRSGVFRTPLSI